MSDRKLTSQATLRARTPADPLSLESLKAWLETMPPEQEYCYLSRGHCLLAQFAKARLGIVKPRVSTGAIWDGANEHLLPGATRRDSLRSPLDKISSAPPHTFGAALERAKALQENTHV